MNTSSSVYQGNKESNHFFRRNDSITLDQIKVFVAIYELGSLSKAALAMHKTQPSISHNLAKLEEKLNVQLVKRTRGKAIAFTEEGHRFYHDVAPLVDKLLLKIDEVENKNAITIGVPDDLDINVQLDLYRQISTMIDSRLRFICGFSTEIRSMVENGRISFGIIKQPAADGTLHFAWAADRHRYFDDDDKLPLVAGYSGCIIRDMTERQLNKADKDFYFVYLSSRIQNRIEAVCKGFGVGVFSLPLIEKTEELIQLSDNSGFPELSSFNHRVIGEADTAQKSKIKPIMSQCVQQLNKPT